MRKERNVRIKKKRELNIIHPNAAGIDVGSEIHYAAVPDDRDLKPVRSFKCYTADLYRLADWLELCGIDTVAMESTGVYWIPVYQILESKGFDVYLVNARHVKNVPGRKTDIKDCQWLQKLHSFGLLSSSFRPDDKICVLRSYIRQRDNLIRSASVHIQRMQKALTQMNIQLHKVISDITGLTGMRIIKAILEGERDTKKLAMMKHINIKSTIEKIAKALEGDYRKEHLFSVRQELELYEFYKAKIRVCDIQIEKHLNSFESKKEPDKIKQYKKISHKTRGYEPQFDLTSHLIRITGVDLTKIVGIEASLAQTIISEIGLDMSKWKTEKHFASWLGLCPNHKITGKKVKSSNSLKVVNRAATSFRLAARSTGTSQSALGAFYRRIRAKAGAPIAITSTAHKIARILYRMLKYGEEFVSMDMDYYEKQYRERIIKNLKVKAKRLGFTLIPDISDMKEIPVSENEKFVS